MILEMVDNPDFVTFDKNEMKLLIETEDENDASFYTFSVTARISVPTDHTASVY